MASLPEEGATLSTVDSGAKNYPDLLYDSTYNSMCHSMYHSLQPLAASPPPLLLLLLLLRKGVCQHLSCSDEQHTYEGHCTTGGDVCQMPARLRMLR